jgi:hypothetical protein
MKLQTSIVKSGHQLDISLDNTGDPDALPCLTLKDSAGNILEEFDIDSPADVAGIFEKLMKKHPTCTQLLDTFMPQMSVVLLLCIEEGMAWSEKAKNP